MVMMRRLRRAVGKRGGWVNACICVAAKSPPLNIH